MASRYYGQNPQSNEPPSLPESRQLGLEAYDGAIKLWNQLEKGAAEAAALFDRYRPILIAKKKSYEKSTPIYIALTEEEESFIDYFREEALRRNSVRMTEVLMKQPDFLRCAPDLRLMVPVIEVYQENNNNYRGVTIRPYVNKSGRYIGIAYYESAGSKPTERTELNIYDFDDYAVRGVIRWVVEPFTDKFGYDHGGNWKENHTNISTVAYYKEIPNTKFETIISYEMFVFLFFVFLLLAGVVFYSYH